MIRGIIPALVTPFNQDGSINLDEAKKLFDYTIEGGVHGLFIMGTNGEFYAIDNDEAVRYTEFTAKYINHRIPVFVGLASNNTDLAIKQGMRLKNAGAEYFTVITPYFQALSDNELIQYYTDMADALKTPLLIYNIPARTNINVSAGAVRILADNEYIIGIKDSSGNMDNLKSYIEASEGKDFDVLCGSDSKILTALKMGAKGAVASTSNLIPKTIVGIYENFLSGDIEKAEVCQAELEKLRLTMKLAGTPAVLKKSLFMIGINAGDPAKPVKPAESPEIIEAIKEMLTYYRLL